MPEMQNVTLDEGNASLHFLVKSVRPRGVVPALLGAHLKSTGLIVTATARGRDKKSIAPADYVRIVKTMFIQHSTTRYPGHPWNIPEM